MKVWDKKGEILKDHVGRRAEKSNKMYHFFNFLTKPFTVHSAVGMCSEDKVFAGKFDLFS